jgi:hypothetical protein
MRPGSLVTYEPQVNSDVFGMFQSLVDGRVVSCDLLVKDVPKDKHQDLDYISGCWIGTRTSTPTSAATPRYSRIRYVRSRRARPMGTASSGCATALSGSRRKNSPYCRSEPSRSRTLVAYGLIVAQGEGVFGGHRVNAPTMIRFGEMTQDELFVMADAARAGVRIDNQGTSDPLVILKHFGPGNPDNEPLRRLRAR